MPSAVIAAFDYDGPHKELHITFVSRKKYIYEKVPQQVFDAFRASGSKGRYFNKNIRRNYSFREWRPAPVLAGAGETDAAEAQRNRSTA